MGPLVPVHGFQPRGLDGQALPHTDVETTAASYVQALLSVSPRGPHHLVGHSFGGWIVLEMARQLTEAGHVVAPVVVLDGDPPSAHGAKRRQYSRVEALMELLHNLSLSSGQPVDVTEQELLKLDDEAQLERLLRWMIQSGIMHARTQLQSVRGLVDVFVANINTSYWPVTPWAGEVVLVQTGQKRGESLDPVQAQAQWRQQCGQLRTYATTGNHMTMLDHPHIDSLWRTWWA
jgi:arthrofactin-type cyclic lipopeptide synthetase C